ncbi:hypothetical protein [Spongiactinospora sp. TRM90649]|uniref:hypothetical protein n=1 Tax=Spongiactinospora sp. TRM90649 TaxID=3031114 RepID=UPI0023F9B1BC|nr:hypothetical protein [Spongiactinospora sp. TRM90649]MDF5751656.1 hypothetical protein [Spongiactinospora sp. TRM90649]
MFNVYTCGQRGYFTTPKSIKVDLIGSIDDHRVVVTWPPIMVVRRRWVDLSDDGARIAGKLSIWLAGIFAMIALIHGVVNLFLKNPVPIPLELVSGYLMGTLATFIAYVYDRSESMIARQERLLRQPARGVEVFKTSEEFLKTLVEITAGATTVSTLNLSPAQGEHPELDRYFSEVHGYIRSKKSTLKSFRSIASVDTEQKSLWLVQRSAELLQTGRVSFAIFDQDRVRPLLHPLSLHITSKRDVLYVFIFPPVNLTGSMDSILISDPVLGKVMLDYYNVLWHDSLKINEGGIVRRAGLERLRELNPDIEANVYYETLRRGIING